MNYLTNDKKWIVMYEKDRSPLAYFTNETQANEWVKTVQETYQNDEIKKISVMRTKEYQGLK